jgi:hypothetical protein
MLGGLGIDCLHVVSPLQGVDDQVLEPVRDGGRWETMISIRFVGVQLEGDRGGCGFRVRR